MLQGWKNSGMVPGFRLEPGHMWQEKKELCLMTLKIFDNFRHWQCSCFQSYIFNGSDFYVHVVLAYKVYLLLWRHQVWALIGPHGPLSLFKLLPLFTHHKITWWRSQWPKHCSLIKLYMQVKTVCGSFLCFSLLPFWSSPTHLSASVGVHTFLLFYVQYAKYCGLWS